MKQLWGFDKTRYRGIAKNLARAQTMFALANLYAVRHRLLPPQVRWPCDRLTATKARQTPSQGEPRPSKPDIFTADGRCKAACAELP